MKGMKIYDNGSAMEDRKCYCDYKNNFEPDLPLDSNVVYFYEDDNDCIPSDCDLKFLLFYGATTIKIQLSMLV
jgi:hypothetical protein